MALFGSNEQMSSVKTVRPTVIRTQNIAKELTAIAKSYEIKTETLDFNILDVQTYTRMIEENKETEWELINNDNLYELDDETALLNPFFQIKQTYEIEIFSLSSERKILCKNLKLSVGANASKCKVYLSINAGSTLEYYPNIESDLLTLINKRKARAGILIHIFDEMLGNVISKISSKARVNEKITYKKAETILIAESYEPTSTINDALILHYENNNEDINDNDKVDYAARGFIKSVKKDELVIEYVHAKPGLAGRNCRGQFMQPSEPVVSHEVTFKIDETISVKETEKSIEYRSNENGYIVFKDDTYSIQTDMEIGEISFKTTGFINSGVDSDISLNVKEKNAQKDAIGTGMHVEVSEIDIDGNVGSKAEVIALRATVSGQTHATSILRADKLDINVHRGKAFGKNIHITRLEHGEVDGDNVDISQAQGGTIKAKEIEIEICTSHVTIIATKKIEIQKLQGSENRFIIDPILKKEAQKGLSENQEEINKLEILTKELAKEIQKHTKLITDGTAAFKDIKKRLLQYKKSGVKMPSSFLHKYKQFTSLSESLKELKNEYALKKDRLDLYTMKTVSFQDDILEARVINRDRWIGYNEIIFKLIEPSIELVYKPAEGSKGKIFGLVEVSENQYEIQEVDE